MRTGTSIPARCILIRINTTGTNTSILGFADPTGRECRSCTLSTVSDVGQAGQAGSLSSVSQRLTALPAAKPREVSKLEGQAGSLSYPRQQSAAAACSISTDE